MTPEEYAKFAATLYKALRSARMDIPRYGISLFDAESAFELTKTVLREVAAQRGAK